MEKHPLITSREQEDQLNQKLKREERMRALQEKGYSLVRNEPIVLLKSIERSATDKNDRFQRVEFDAFLFRKENKNGISLYKILWGKFLENEGTNDELKPIESQIIELSNGEKFKVNTMVKRIYPEHTITYTKEIPIYDKEGKLISKSRKVEKLGKVSSYIRDRHYFLFPIIDGSQNQDDIINNSSRVIDGINPIDSDQKQLSYKSGKNRKKGFNKTDKIIAFCIIGFFLSLVIWAVWSKSKKESQQERTYQTENVIEAENADNIAEQITKQLDQLTEAINALPEPNENNVSRCGDKVKVLQWEVIDIPEDDPNTERLKKSQRRAIETFVNAKNRYIKKLEKYDEYAGVYYDEVEGYLLDEE